METYMCSIVGIGTRPLHTPSIQQYSQNFLYLPLEYCTVYYNEFPLSSLRVLHCLIQ